MDEGRKIRILVMEDDALVRRMLVSFFQTTEYEILDAEDGEVGLALFRKERPDVVMTDLRMPNVDGWEVLAALKVESPLTPVIVFSGAGDLENALEAVRRGAWDYINKPIYELTEIEIVLKQVLERAHLLAENQRYQRDLEALVESRTAALEASERRLTQIVEGAAVGVFVVDANGVITHWNRACELITGVAPRDVIGTVGVRAAFARGDMPLLSEMVLAGTPLSEMRSHCHFRIAASASVPGAFEFEDFFPGFGPRGKWLFLTASPLQETDGSIVGVIETVRDVSERKNAEDAAAQLDERIRNAQKMEALGQLAGGIAHDFNNILGGLIGFTEMALDSVPADGKTAEHLGRVLAAGKRAADLVRSILAFGRQSTSKLVPTRLGPIAAQVLDVLAPSLPPSIRVEKRVDEKCGQILADGGQLGQVLMNLCTNACYAMKDEGGVMTVTVEEVDVRTRIPSDRAGVADVEVGRYARLSVSDTGVGMDDETRKRIFEPYFSTKPVGEGTGLGLAIVHGVVASHRGSVRVESPKGGGARFELYFPLLEETAFAPFEAAAPEGAEVRGKERVMFVDDEPQLTALLDSALGLLGYKITTFPSGQKAIEALLENRDAFDIAVLDYVMPGMNGVETARRLHEARPDLPILMCTGYGFELSKKEADRIGIRGHLEKPTSIKAIALAIRKEMDARGTTTKRDGP